MKQIGAIGVYVVIVYINAILWKIKQIAEITCSDSPHASISE